MRWVGVAAVGGHAHSSGCDFMRGVIARFWGVVGGTDRRAQQFNPLDCSRRV
jgi:hypothetical protein